MSTSNEPLDPRMQKAFEHLARTLPRDPSAAARGRAAFMAQARTLQSRQASLSTSRLSLFMGSFPKRLSLATALIGMLVVLFLFGGTSLTVYAAQESLPDSPLYPVKTLSEDTRLAVASEPQAKLDLLLTFAERRISEISALNSRAVTLPNAVETRLQNHLDEAVSVAADLPDNDRTLALERIIAAIQKQQEKLSAVQARVPAPAQPAIQRVQDMLQDRKNRVETGIENPSSLPPKGNGKSPPGQERKQTVQPGQGGRPTTAAPGEQRHSTVTPPGLEHRPTGVPGGNPNPGKGKEGQAP